MQSKPAFSFTSTCKKERRQGSVDVFINITSAGLLTKKTDGTLGLDLAFSLRDKDIAPWKTIVDPNTYQKKT